MVIFHPSSAGKYQGSTWRSARWLLRVRAFTHLESHAPVREPGVDAVAEKTGTPMRYIELYRGVKRTSSEMTLAATAPSPASFGGARRSVSLYQWWVSLYQWWTWPLTVQPDAKIHIAPS